MWANVPPPESVKESQSIPANICVVSFVASVLIGLVS